MAEPMPEERLAEIREHQQWYPNIDVRDLSAEVERLTAALQRRTEEWEGEQAARVAAEQATIAADQRAQKAEAERDEARKGKVEQMLGRLDDWGGDLATVVQERDAARAERDEVLAEMREEARTADELRRNRDQLHDELTAARAEMEKRGKALADWQRVAGQHQAAMLDAKNRADHLTQQIQGLWTVKTWTNEDRRKFVFVEDLLNALQPDLAPNHGTEPVDLAQQRHAVIALIREAYRDARTPVEDGDPWPTWGPSIDALDILRALGALEDTIATTLAGEHRG